MTFLNHVQTGGATIDFAEKHLKLGFRYASSSGLNPVWEVLTSSKPSPPVDIEQPTQEPGPSTSGLKLSLELRLGIEPQLRLDFGEYFYT